MINIERRLTIKSLHISSLKFADKFSIESGCLSVVKEDVSDDDISSIEMTIIKPGEDKDIHGIMDVMPISTKVIGKIGEGLTHTLTGVYILMTGYDEDGKDYYNFGCSAGKLSERLVRDMPGTPAKDDLVLHIDIRFRKDKHHNREAIEKAHYWVDSYVQSVRDILKKIDSRSMDEKHVFYDKSKPGKKKVAIVKMFGAQGAMHDSLILPREPGSTLGSKSLVDLQGLPVVLSPNEYRDGALRALT